MVHLETFACFVCSKQCMPDFDGHQTGKSGRIGIYCHGIFNYYVFCGTCSKKGLAIVENGLVTAYSACLENVLPAVAYLANVAPGEELKLLNFGKWNAVNVCANCNTPTDATRFNIINCLNCEVGTWPPLFDFVRTILKELSSFCLNVPYEPVERKASLVVSDFFACSVCHKEATGFSSSGSLYCAVCRERWAYNHIDSKMLWTFNQLIRCIPDAQDLGLLTFSKWTPFRCETCSIPFTDEPSRFPFYHAICGVMRCRRCFDSNGCCNTILSSMLIRLPFIIVAAQKLQMYFKTISCSLENYGKEKLSNDVMVNQILPRNARCACGRVEDVDQLFKCSDCSSAGFCAVCLFDNHWKHDVCRIKPRMLRTVVRENSDKTLGKMLSWIERTKELHSHSIDVFADLIDLLGKLYTTAMCSEDEHFVAGLLADADVSMFEAEFERLADEKEKVITKMCQFRDVLRKRLTRDDRLTMERP